MRLLGRTMKICCVTFNTYLCALALLGLCGCLTDQGNETKPSKQMSSLRIHCETVSGGSTPGIEVPIWRSSPKLVPIDRAAFVTEANVMAAAVVEQPGGFAIEVQLDRQGTWLLEKNTVLIRGRRLAIFGEFGEDRWLAAPVISKVISNGRLVFTPDATREEAERLVLGLNNVSRKLKTKNNW